MVAVIAGEAQRSFVVTDADGAYRLQLAAGFFKLRWSKTGFQAIDRDEQSVEAGDHLTMADILLKTARITKTGKKELIAEERDWQRANEIIARCVALRGEEQ